MAPKLTPKERARIIVLLKEHGGNRHRVAMMVGRAKDTVARIANDEGIPSDVRKTKKASEARSAHAEIDRMEGVATILRVGVSLIQKLEGQPPTPETMRAYKDGAMGYAIGIDKDLLLSGKPTNINENRKGETVKDWFSDIDNQAAAEWSRSRESGDSAV